MNCCRSPRASEQISSWWEIYELLPRVRGLSREAAHRLPVGARNRCGPLAPGHKEPNQKRTGESQKASSIATKRECGRGGGHGDQLIGAAPGLLVMDFRQWVADRH